MTQASPMNDTLDTEELELWGGIECTVNRVGEEYFDQLERNGHAERIADIEAVAALGIRAIRYPVLWERAQPDEIGRIDWSWSDARLAPLRERLRPIAGLTHQRSGPRCTSLVDPEFPRKFPDFARATAERFPWLTDFTPVNEPVTTARFSGLYGFWYPHGKDDATFARALVTQCRAVVSAMRSIREGTPEARLAQTQDLGRYGLPLAITEAHLRGTREEQLRWLYEIWDFAKRARGAKVDVRAVTAWPVLGAYDWNVLVTRKGGFYEPGRVDVRAPTPKPTALARLVSDLAHGRSPEDEPLIAQPGGWRRRERLFQQPASGRAAQATQASSGVDMLDRSFRPLLIVGAHGTLGAAFVRLCDARGIGYHLAARNELDLSRPVRADQLLLETNAWAVVNAAGYVRVDDAEHEPEVVEQVNAAGPAALAAACARQGLPLLTFSSDLVFDGQTTSPYTESARVAPLNVYGRSKAAMETSVLANNPSALVIRTSAFFGPWDEANFVTRSLHALRAGHVVTPLEDVVVSPTYVPDLVNAALDLLIDRERGIWHLANTGAVTWYELACRAAVLAGLPTDQIKPCSASELGLTAPRPRYSALESERGWIMPSLDDALTRYLVGVQAPDAPLAA